MTSTLKKSNERVDSADTERKDIAEVEVEEKPRELTPEEKMAELENQKDLIWGTVLFCKQGSPDHDKFSKMYINVCRKIFKLKYGLD